MAEYLKDLRTNRVARPIGSRPPPPSRIASKRKHGYTNSVGTIAPEVRPVLPTSNSMPAVIPPPRCSSALSERRDPPSLIHNDYAGRPLVPRPLAVRSSKPASSSSIEDEEKAEKRSGYIYKENGQRWMDRQEARSLRMALEEMDLDEEQRVHAAAQDEAAELVHKHRNPNDPSNNPAAPYKNPDLTATQRDYRAHLRKGSYSRSHSRDSSEPAVRRSASQSRSSSSASDRVDAPKRSSMIEEAKSYFEPAEIASAPATPAAERPSSSSEKQNIVKRGKKSYEALANTVAADIAKSQRRVSSGSKRKPSGGNTPFLNPDDRIYEEPEEAVPEGPKPAQAPKAVEVPKHVRKNPFARVRLAQEKLERANTAPVISTRKFDKVEIQRNPPSQSRKAWYLSNETLPPTPPKPKVQEEADDDEENPRMKDGREVRGDDIRAATSAKRKDRSPNLPQPTAVSDSPGRPIVSFHADWKATKEIELVEEHSPSVPKPVTAEEPTSARPVSRTGSKALFGRDTPTQGPRVRPTTPCVPSINLPGAPTIPTINLPDGPAIPSIVLPEEPDIPAVSIQSAPATPGIPTINVPSIAVDAPPAVPAISIPSISVNEPPAPSNPSTRSASRPRAPPAASRPAASRPTPPSRPLPTTQQHPRSRPPQHPTTRRP
ncbi:hypothetical protein H2203_003259 [Taxawa tesnikishii (nom. ined.)]|nr:hypothetical protein H2203_003259 [Dothideales sp. JES 119]